MTAQPLPEPPAPAIVVEMQAQIRVSTQIDMVTYFTHLSGADQRLYTDLDVWQWGYEEEHERPLAYLMSAADAYGDVTLIGGRGRGVLREVEDTDDMEAKVRTRGTREHLYGAGAEWTEEDYATLCDAIPWMAEHRTQTTGEAPEPDLAWPHLSRVPALTDVPLIPMIGDLP